MPLSEWQNKISGKYASKERLFQDCDELIAEFHAQQK